jgi:hypothetical protein
MVKNVFTVTLSLEAKPKKVNFQGQRIHNLFSSLIENGLGVPWIAYIRPGASDNPPNRHIKLEVQDENYLI